MSERILIIDDDSAFRKILARTLEGESYAVDSAPTGKAGVAAAQRRAHDLIIRTPVLILTANDQDGQDVSCLDMGADDYLTKPAKADRLLAHVRALLRRSPQAAAGAASEQRRLGALLLDADRRLVTLDGVEYPHLTSKEFGLLYDLALHSPKPRNRQALYLDVWGMPHPSEVSLKTVDVHVRRIRLKLGWRSDRWLLSVSGLGYCLVPPKD
ncbi:MAG: response regulator transcription factor [Elusimicrobia bacterium]|nr:response regulator transcription factor [Elusimicrobiota bacterium]